MRRSSITRDKVTIGRQDASYGVSRTRVSAELAGHPLSGHPIDRTHVVSARTRGASCRYSKCSLVSRRRPPLDANSPYTRLIGLPQTPTAERAQAPELPGSSGIGRLPVNSRYGLDSEHRYLVATHGNIPRRTLSRVFRKTDRSTSLTHLRATRQDALPPADRTRRTLPK